MDSFNDSLPLPLLTPPLRSVPDRRSGERRSLLSAFKARVTKDWTARTRGERRATPRLQVELECEERTGDSRLFRITTDLSTFGLATRQGGTHPVGTFLHLTLHLPDGLGEPLELEAEVLGAFDAFGGMRLAFRNPPAHAARRIHRYLAGRTSG